MPSIRIEMNYYTYAYLREDKTPYYIGKGKGLRIYSTNRRIKPPKDKSRIIYLKQNLTEKEAFRHEIYMIAVFGRKDLGTGILINMTNGGDGPSGRIVSEETRRKLSEAGKDHIVSEEQKIKQRKKMKGRIKKHNLSEEGRKKLSKIMLGNTRHNKPHSEEAKKKISQGHKGKKLTEEHRKKLRDSHIGIKHQPHTQETKNKISQIHKKSGLLPPSHKGTRWWNNGQINKRSIECPGKEWILGKVIKCQLT